MNQVNVSQLKANLAKYLRMVRKGIDLVIFSHSQPIAVLRKYQFNNIEMTDPQGHPCDVLDSIFKNSEFSKGNISTQILIKERSRQ